MDEEMTYKDKTYVCEIPAKAVIDNLYCEEWPATTTKEQAKLNTWMAVNDWGVNKEGEPHNRYFRPIIK